MLPAVADQRTKNEPEPEGPVQLNLRVSKQQAAGLDAWLKKLNEGRWPKLTRTDVLRKLVDWGIENQPEWIGK